MAQTFPSTEKRCQVCDCIMHADESQCPDCLADPDTGIADGGQYAGLSIVPEAHQTMHTAGARKRKTSAALSA